MLLGVMISGSTTTAASPVNEFLLPALITFLVLLISSLVYFVWRKCASKADTIVLVGLNGSGKTKIFAKLINSGIHFAIVSCTHYLIVLVNFRKQLGDLYFYERKCVH